MSYKRGRAATAYVRVQRPRFYNSTPRTVYRKTTAPRGSVVPGFTRRTGFYGRYHTSVSKGTGELKFYDDDLAQFIVPDTGIIVDSVNKVAQGVGESDRIGRKFTIKRIEMASIWILPGLTAINAGYDTILCLVYLDKQANGVAATITDLLTDTVNDKALSRSNVANKNRFRILKRFLITISPNTTDSADGTVSVARHTDWSIPCNIPIEMSATSGAMSTIRSNNIGLAFISQIGNAAVKFTTRIYFSDT